MGDTIFMIGFIAFFALPFVTYLGLVASGAVQLPAGKQGGAGRRLLGPMIIGYYYWLLGPLFRFVNGTSLRPNQITMASLGAALVTAAAIATGHFSLAACLLIGGATLDIVDGQLARAKKLSTPSGAFLDSTLDRICDGLIFGGCVIYYAGTPMMYVSLVVMIMSFTVSYARARGETLGVSGAEGLMQRADRITILGIALAFSAFVGHRTEGFVAHPFYGVTAVALCIMAVLNTVTVVSRIRFTMLRLDEGVQASGSAQPAHLNLVRPARTEPARVGIRRAAAANDAAPLLNQRAR
jgi:phosphatidylglycerophosphate synthase